MVCACGTQKLDGGLIVDRVDSGAVGQDATAIVATGGSGGSSGGGIQPSGGAGGSAVLTGLPCDIYASEGGPCVAAYSTVRALLAAYSGALYQVRRQDGTTKDIPVLAPGALADSSVQDAFCNSFACTISILYDQSGRGNHLTYATGGMANKSDDKEADANALPITIQGRKVYGEHNPPGVGYRNNQAKGTATGDDPETIYMIANDDSNGGANNFGCCFTYGNAETDNGDNGDGAMEAVYLGSSTLWGRGAGNGPWVMGALENGLWPGSTSYEAANTPMTSKYVTAMVKGDKAGANHWAIKAGNAQSGLLTTMFDGQRPSRSTTFPSTYNPMKKEGAIILGISGDNSNAAQGNFFEGVMTAHYSSDAADDAVQANIVSVYGQ